jgi:uncharacterized spore protein YtfJ
MVNQAQEILQSMSERFAAGANVKQVFGEPIVSGGKTVIPVARMRYFLGGGWGGGEHKGEHVERPLSGGGGGGGGAVTASPVGALEITDAGVRFIRFYDPAQIAKVCLGGMVALLLVSRLFRRRG